MAGRPPSPALSSRAAYTRKRSLAPGRGPHVIRDDQYARQYHHCAERGRRESLQTTTGTSGNASNLVVNASSLTLSNVTLNGSGAGSGGTLTGVTPNGVAIAGFVPAEIILNANDIDVSGAVTANGGSSGGAGGTVTLNSEDDVNVNSYDSQSNFLGGFISVNGGGSGSGGTIYLTSGNDINLERPPCPQTRRIPRAALAARSTSTRRAILMWTTPDSNENFVNGSVSADGGDAGSISTAPRGGNGSSGH